MGIWSSRVAATSATVTPQQGEGIKQNTCVSNKTHSQHSSSASVLDSRIPLNNGWGDFCFGRLIDRHHGRPPSRSDFDPTLAEDSNGVIVIEADGYERKGSFPFFKLPKEIRRMIFYLLLEPFYEYDHETKAMVIQVTVGKDSNHKDLRYLGVGNMYSESFGTYITDDFWWTFDDFPQKSVCPCPVQYEQERQKFYYDKIWMAQNSLVHPHRQGTYKLSVDPRKLAKGPSWPAKDWLYLDWVRNAANTSCNFRHEMGEIFWARTSVRLLDIFDLRNFTELLADRPAIHRGIKRVELCISRLDLTHASEALPSWCNAIGGKLELDALRVVIYLGEDELLPIIEDGGRASGLSATKNIPVRLAFDLTLYMYDKWDLDYTLSEKYQPLLRQIMSPSSLQPEPNTEMEGYLRSRARAK